MFGMDVGFPEAVLVVGLGQGTRRAGAGSAQDEPADEVSGRLL
jgi:hypothetical protein